MEKNRFVFTPSWNPPPKYKDWYVLLRKNIYYSSSAWFYNYILLTPLQIN